MMQMRFLFSIIWQMAPSEKKYLNINENNHRTMNRPASLFHFDLRIFVQAFP